MPKGAPYYKFQLIHYNIQSKIPSVIVSLRQRFQRQRSSLKCSMVTRVVQAYLANIFIASAIQQTILNP